MSKNTFIILLIIFLFLPFIGFLYWPFVIVLFFLYIYSWVKLNRISMIAYLLLLTFLEGSVRSIENRQLMIQELFPFLNLSGFVISPIFNEVEIVSHYHLSVGLLLIILGVIQSLLLKAYIPILVILLTIPGMYATFQNGDNGFIVTLYACIWLLWLFPLKDLILKLKIFELYSVWQFVLFFLLIATIGFSIGISGGHIGFLATGFSFICYNSRRISFFLKILLAISHFLILLVGTFTLKAIVIFSFIYFLIFKAPKFVFKSVKLFLVFSIIILFFLSIYVPINSSQISNNTINNSLFSDKLQDKIVGDRIPIWVATSFYIISDFSFFVPSNRVVPLPEANWAGNEWTVGAHNLLLEVFRQFGIWIGVIILFIFFLEVFKSIKLYKMSLVISIAIVILTTYGFTGHYLIYNSVGLFYIFMIILHARTHKKNTKNNFLYF